MNRILVAGLVALCIVVGGCGKTHESIRKDAMGKMKDMTAVLKDVKDEASAKAAAPKLKAIAEDIKKLKEADDKLGKLSKEDEKKLEEKFDKEAKPIMEDFMKEMMRIAADPKAAAVLQDAMKDMKDLK